MNKIEIAKYREVAVRLSNTLKSQEYNQDDAFSNSGCFITHIQKISGSIRDVFEDTDLSATEIEYIVGTTQLIRHSAKSLGFSAPTDFTLVGLVSRIDDVIALHEN